jgi:peptidyl-prolyl cis-trans isomerase D
MLSFFRRFLRSPVVLGLFGLILIAFLITGVGTPSGVGGIGEIGAGDSIFTVGGASAGSAEVAKRVQIELENAKQQQPTLDMKSFVAAGGVESAMGRMISGLAIERFGNQQGMVVSRRTVDGLIASRPEFAGPAGGFDRNTFLQRLAQNKVSEAQVRDDFARQSLIEQLIAPVTAGARAPTTLVAPYANLLLETRKGLIGAVATTAVASGAAPTGTELSLYYTQNTARYTVPERRVIRYAVLDRTRFEGKVQPTEAEIATAYAADKAKYAGREERVLTQVIVADQAGASALAAKVRAGASMAEASKTAGLEPTTFPAQSKIAYSGVSAPAVADAAFALPKGSISAPTKSAFGWHVVKVDSIVTIAAKTLDDARGSITSELSSKKVDQALADLVAKIEDDIEGGSTFDDVVKAQGLQAVTTPSVTAGGLAPDDKAFKPSKDLAPILRDAFQAEPDDKPVVTNVTAGTSFALNHLEQVVAAAPRPLAQIHDQVAGDFMAERAKRAAKQAADAIAAKLNKGVPFDQAIAGAGIKLPTPQPIGARRIDLVQSQKQVPPPLALLFSMSRKSAKVLEAPNNAGWFVIYLDVITPGDVRTAPQLVAITQQQLGKAVGEEYLQQFVGAAKAEVGVKRNEGALARLKQGLSGAGPASQ